MIARSAIVQIGLNDGGNIQLINISQRVFNVRVMVNAKMRRQ